jgi:hypothetical protein
VKQQGEHLWVWGKGLPLEMQMGVELNSYASGGGGVGSGPPEAVAVVDAVVLPEEEPQRLDQAGSRREPRLRRCY